MGGTLALDRTGYFAVYHGKEYHAGLLGKRRQLFSGDATTAVAGFVPDPLGGFIKEVARDDIEEYFARYTHGLYHGIEVSVNEERDNKLEISPVQFLSADARHNLGFQERERLAYYKWVNPDDLERIWEVKRPL